ncbi:hypothetical protein [Streptomyces sp. 1222.5]|uniref:hypothetical protein n=1 Tax=Streptomyces sp. 1222.5 TaxID=1881026 RepID=UPI003EC092B5
MATYVITGRNASNEPLLSVNVSGINQDAQVVEEIDVINAVRTYVAGVPGVKTVVAQKYEQVITVV